MREDAVLRKERERGGRPSSCKEAVGCFGAGFLERKGRNNKGGESMVEGEGNATLISEKVGEGGEGRPGGGQSGGWGRGSSGLTWLLLRHMSGFFRWDGGP